MINNEFYKDLGEKWHTSSGDAVALLRLENKTKAPWVITKLNRHHAPDAKVLDVGCGGGFLSLELAARGFHVTALDVDERVLASGRARDSKNQIDWKVGTAEQLPLPIRPSMPFVLWMCWNMFTSQRPPFKRPSAC